MGPLRGSGSAFVEEWSTRGEINLLRWLWVALAGLGVLLAVWVLGALNLRSLPSGLKNPPLPDVDAVSMLETFRVGLRIPTISHQPGMGGDDSSFADLRRHLVASYPLIHEALERDRVSAHTLVFRWEGNDPSLPATVLMAHQDVVPVDAGSESDWLHPPFGAEVEDGFVWARGALDDKLGLFAILESVEALLRQGFEPRRTLYLVFGHDEELGGPEGASQVALLLAQRGVEVGLVLDEGGAVTEGQVPGVTQSVALVGVAEKGYMTLLLEVNASGGHSSAPPSQTAIGILSQAIARLEANPFDADLGEVGRAFFEQGLGPASSFGLKLVYGNLWFFEPLLIQVLKADSSTAAMVRTTTAPTLIEAGTKENILPTRASAFVNFRILPGENQASVVSEVRRTVSDDRVLIRVAGDSRAPSKASSLDSPAWETLRLTIREIFPDAVVAPYLVLGGTDSRYFRPLCDCVYRFLPVRLGSDSMSLAHGTNERIPIASLLEAVRFYHQLILNTDSASF